MSLFKGLVNGALAGAAGTTALNAVSYLDMVWRGRAASTTPSDSVERLAERAGVTIPGTEAQRGNRVEALGPLLGIATGMGLGAVLGAAGALGVRTGPVRSVAVASLAALLVSNVPMTALGVTDPRTWSAADWVSDIVPHLAYGAVTGHLLEHLPR
jgi:hypothetical protein